MSEINKNKNYVKVNFFTVVLAVSLLAGVGLPATAAAIDINFSNVRVGKVSPGSGHVGVDILWPSGGGAYAPCHHSNDAYYGSCVLSNAATSSYYKVGNFTSSTSNFPYGIFVDNQNANNCTTSAWCTNKTAPSFNHGWGRLISDASLEIYPYDSMGNYNPSGNNVGGVRIQVNHFPVIANGGRYSDNIGDVSLPQLGQPNVGRMNGFATNNGASVANNRVTLELFQSDSTRTTSTGYPMNGFTVVHSNSDGYYNTGAVPSGIYRIYVTDTQTSHKIILDNIHIVQTYERLDFKLEKPCFGFATSTCTDPAT